MAEVDDGERPLHLLHPVQVPSRGENASVLLRQLLEQMKILRHEDVPSTIDLHAVPLSELDHERLHEILGEGAIQAVVETEESRIEVVQSGISGIWWLTHFDSNGELMGEFIEVNYVPEVLFHTVDELDDGMEALMARLISSEFLQKR